MEPIPTDNDTTAALSAAVKDICTEYARGEAALAELCIARGLSEASFHSACEVSPALHQCYLHSQRVLQRMHMSRWAEAARKKLHKQLNGNTQREVSTEEMLNAEGEATATRRRTTVKRMPPGMPALAYTLTRLENMIQKQEARLGETSSLAALLDLPDNGRRYPRPA